MSIEERFGLIKEVGEEILTEEELRELLVQNKHPVAYDGFEPSGTMHIAQGLLRAINVNKMLSAGCTFTMWVADWFAWANNKLGGDLDKIHVCGEYMIEVWKACGMDTGKVKFVWVSEKVNDPEYWKIVMEVARHSTVQRILRCSQIMGRSEKDVLQASQILYPCMQCADVMYLDVDICQLGMDQRKVNVLARELGPKLGFKKPVVVSHHMLMGLGQPPKSDLDSIERATELKMSKSKPHTAIFMTDTPDMVREKIMKAYCPVGVTFENPLMEYAKYIIFPKQNTLSLTRPAKFGGDITLPTYAELEQLYAAGKLHPMDLKTAVAEALVNLLAPVQKHFASGKPQKLLEQIRSFDITR
ncbi:MAG: tyrosine--tRNA ligase [Candidatus Woesearchaeota archaeon]|nr:tyrosine--tRNA ligase [Candidatus Woesearchaeota archaeon]